MTDLQRRGRRELVLLLAILGLIFLPASIGGIWQARQDWRQLGPAIGLLVGLLAVGAGLWRGDRPTRYAAIMALGLVGLLLIFLGIARGREAIGPEVRAAYERIGFHPLAALYGTGAVSLLSAAALAFSAPIRAYWDGRRDRRAEATSLTPADRGPLPPAKAAVAEVVHATPGPSLGDQCLACGAPMAEAVVQCPSCGWTYQGEDANRTSRPDKQDDGISLFHRT
jgi:hypothetical protein